MLQALLLAGIVAAPLGSAALFLPARRHARRAGIWSATRRFVVRCDRHGRARRGGGGHPQAARRVPAQPGAGGAAVALASLLWLPVTRHWSARAHLCWASSVYLFVVYLIYALEWTFASHLGLASTAGGVLLWLLEVVAAMMSCAYLWEMCDALGTAHWHRRRAPLDPRRRVPPRPAGGGSAQITLAHGQPACPGAQRAAGHGHRHAARAAAPRLPPVRDRPHRRQHRRRGLWRPVRGLVPAARRHVHAPGRTGPATSPAR